MGNHGGSSPPPDISFFIDSFKLMQVVRSQWPHTVDDIVKALDGVWGVVGAISTTGNLLRLERSFATPVVYKFVEYDGNNEERPLREQSFQETEKAEAVKQFASLLGFE